MTGVTVTKTINYGWKNFSEHYIINCEECKKTLTRTVSDGCNSLANRKYKSDLVNKLKKQAEKLSETEKETCVGCLKKRLKKNNINLKPFPQDEIDAADLVRKASEIATADENKYHRSLSKKYHGTIVIHNNEEWVIEYIASCWNKSRLDVCLYRVNKQQPWKITDIQKHIPLNKIVIMNETIQERAQAIQ